MTPWANSDLISTSIIDFTILRIKQYVKTGGLVLGSVKKQNTVNDVHTLITDPRKHKTGKI